MMMQVNKFIPIDEKYTNADYVNDIYPFEIRFAFNSFAPYVYRNLFCNRFADNVFRSETGAGDIIYYPNQIEDSILMSLYYKKELYTLIDDEIVCLDNNSLLYPFIEHFAQGFTRGYFEVKNNLEIENNVQSVFNIAINESLSGLDTAYKDYNFNGHNIKILSDELIYESGVKTGRNYRAWQVILDKPYLYIQQFHESENLILFYKWNLNHEIKKQDQRDTWGRKKGLEILLTHDINPKLLEKVEKKMLDYGSLEPAVTSDEDVNKRSTLDKGKEKSNVIDLTETATFGKNKKYDYPFHPDSEEYWLFEVPNDEKLRILLEKFNQNDGYFRSHSIEHLIETIFNSSKGQFLEKKRYAEKRINDIPEIKQQYVIDEKLKTLNEIEELKKVLKGSEPSEGCFLDLERSQEVLIEYTFPPLGFKNVKEIENYLLSLIAYRGNLLYIIYLKQQSAPEPEKIVKLKTSGGKTISNIRDSDITIRDYFGKAMITDKKQTKALHSTLKAMGITKDMEIYKDEQKRVRQILVRMEKWKTKATIKPQSS